MFHKLPTRNRIYVDNPELGTKFLKAETLTDDDFRT